MTELGFANNPAGRLHAVLSSALQTRERLRKKTIADGWADVLGCDQGNAVRLLEKVSLVLRLPAEIVKQVEADGGINQNLYLSWRPTVSKAFSTMNFENSWTAFLDQFDTATIQALGFCDDRLKSRSKEAIPDAAQLEALLADVQGLIARVTQDGDLDQHLREYLLDYLLRIERAIQDFKLQGMRPLRQAVESTFGAVILQKPTAQQVETSPHGRDFWSAVCFAAVVAFAGNVPSALLPQQVEIVLPEGLKQTIAELQDTVNEQDNGSQRNMIPPTQPPIAE